MADSILSTFEEYTRLYSARDVEGVTNLCLWPFLAIRRGEAIHMQTAPLSATTSPMQLPPTA